MKRLTAFAALVILPTAQVCAEAPQEPYDGGPVIADTQDAACAVLKNFVAKKYLESKKPDPLWHCDFTTLSNELVYIVALRYSGRDGPGYSTLVGWYAVARRSTAVMGFDVAELRIVPLEK